MVGCGMQQARSARAEQTVEAGWNGKGGTSQDVADPDRWEWVTPRVRGNILPREWTLEAYVDEGAVFGQPQERKRIQRTGREQTSVCEPRPSGESSTGPPDREQPLVKTTRCVTRLRRGSEGHEGLSTSWLTRAGCRTVREAPRRSRQPALRRRWTQGQGGQAGKANDPQPGTCRETHQDRTEGPPPEPRSGLEVRRPARNQVLEDPTNLMEGRRISVWQSTTRARLCRDRKSVV